MTFVDSELLTGPKVLVEAGMRFPRSVLASGNMHTMNSSDNSRRQRTPGAAQAGAADAQVR